MKKLLISLLALILVSAVPVHAQSFVTPTTGPVTIDASLCGQGGAAGPNCAFKLSMTGNVTLSLINGIPGQAVKLFINPGAFSLTWPSNVSSPPTLTASQTNAVVLNFDTTSGSWYSSGGSSGGYSSPGSSTYFASNPKYSGGVKAFGHIACSMASTVSSKTITSGTNDPAFVATATDPVIGDIIEMTNQPCTALGFSGALVEVSSTNRIASINSAHSIQIVSNAAGSAGAASCCIGAWAPNDDGPALQASFIDSTTNGQCGNLILPGGVMMINQFITNPASLCGFTNGFNVFIAPGYAVHGQGAITTVIIPMDTLDLTNVGAGTAAFFGIPNSPSLQGPSLEEFSFNGLGVQVIIGGTGKIAFWVGVAGTFRDVQLGEWGTNTSNFTAFEMLGTNGATAYAENVSAYNFGNQGPILQDQVVCVNCFIDTVNPTLISPGNGYVYTFGSQFLNFTPSGNGAITVSNQAKAWYSNTDLIQSFTNATAVVTNANVNFTNTTILYGSGTGKAIQLGGSGGVPQVHATRLTITGTGSGGSITSSVAGANFFDECGNSMTAPVSFTNLGWFGDCSTTGVALAASNITPTSGFGTGCATAGQCISAVSGASRVGQFTVTYGTAPASPQVITIAFPVGFIGPATSVICNLIDVGGTNAFPTSIATTTCTATGASFTITNTPVAGNTDIFQVRANIP